MYRKSKISKGFTLMELAVILVIIGVLATFAVPRLRNAFERSKASEAFKYLAAVMAAQEKYHAINGSYAVDIKLLDIKTKPPADFIAGKIQSGFTGRLKDSWIIMLTRKSSSIGYSSYTVAFTEEGFDSAKSTIAGLPDINPMET